VNLFQKLSGSLSWLGVRLAIAMVAAVSATGFGLLFVPPAHAGLDGYMTHPLESSADSPLPSR
jgi:hypothetical protein